MIKPNVHLLSKKYSRNTVAMRTIKTLNCQTEDFIVEIIIYVNSELIILIMTHIESTQNIEEKRWIGSLTLQDIIVNVITPKGL